MAFGACRPRAYRTLPLGVGNYCNLASERVQVPSFGHVCPSKLGVGVGVGAALEKHGGRDCCLVTATGCAEAGGG